MDGGRVAARGFQYQYLQTLTRILPFLQSADADILTLRVEGLAESAETTGLDVVDFDVINTSGNLLLVAQVKSRSSEYTMSCSEAIDILFRLIGVGESDRYELITNARSSRDLDRLIELQGQSLSDDDYRKELQSLLVRRPQRLRRLADLSNQDVGRLRRCRIELDPRDDYEVRDNLRETLRTHRIRMGLGSGFYSSGLLTGYMISEILRRAADETDSSIGMEA